MSVDAVDRLLMTDDELAQLTGYARPHLQVAELHRQGFHRARIGRAGGVILERAHYEAVASGVAPEAQQAPQVRPPKVRPPTVRSR